MTIPYHFIMTIREKRAKFEDKIIFKLSQLILIELKLSQLQKYAVQSIIIKTSFFIYKNYIIFHLTQRGGDKKEYINNYKLKITHSKVELINKGVMF